MAVQVHRLINNVSVCPAETAGVRVCPGEEKHCCPTSKNVQAKHVCPEPRNSSRNQKIVALRALVCPMHIVEDLVRTQRLHQSAGPIIWIDTTRTQHEHPHGTLPHYRYPKSTTPSGLAFAQVSSRKMNDLILEFNSSRQIALCWNIF